MPKFSRCIGVVAFLIFGVSPALACVHEPARRGENSELDRAIKTPHKSMELREICDSCDAQADPLRRTVEDEDDFRPKRRNGDRKRDGRTDNSGSHDGVDRMRKAFEQMSRRIEMLEERLRQFEGGNRGERGNRGDRRNPNNRDNRMRDRGRDRGERGGDRQRSSECPWLRKNRSFERLFERLEDPIERAFERLEERVRDRIGRRIGRRIRDRLKDPKALDRLEENIERRAEDLLSTPDGRELQRRAQEFMDSPDGRRVREQVEEFMNSEEARELRNRILPMVDRFLNRGGSPKPQRPKSEKEAPEADREAF